MVMLIPRDSIRVVEAANNATVHQKEDANCCKNRLIAVAYMAQAVGYSLLNTFSYIPYGCYKTKTHFCQCNIAQGLQELGTGFGDAGRSLLFVAAGIVVIVASIFSPSAVNCFAKKPEEPPENLVQIISDDEKTPPVTPQSVSEVKEWLSDQSSCVLAEKEDTRESSDALRRAKIDKFRSNAYLDSECIKLWAEHLEISMVTELLCDGNLRAIPVGESVVYIPFILQSSWVNWIDHIVVIAVDYTSQTIEYYNSQGGKIENEARVVKGMDIPANEFVRRFCPEGWQVRSIDVRHQTDWYNCGVYVCRFMEMKANGKSLCAPSDIHAERERMAFQLEDRFFSKNEEWDEVCRTEVLEGDHKNEVRFEQFEVNLQQCNLDFPRGEYKYNGIPYKGSAQDLYEQLQEKGAMGFLQQALFAEVIGRVTQEIGTEVGLKTVKLSYEISENGDGTTVSGVSHLVLHNDNKELANIEVKVDVNVTKKTNQSNWRIVNLEGGDGELSEEEREPGKKAERGD